MADDGLGNDNNTCVVCFKNVTFFSIGECDHPVCYECSARMRVLCLQNECPICRQALSRVSFTDTIIPYKDLRKHVFTERMFERQYKIGFCTEEIKEAYEKLLENRCRYCEKIPPFRSFGALSDHMKKIHERFYCDLCVKHLKIFTSERKCYTRQELAHHRRKGDVDDTSHRGHPLCEFCQERFMDADELYRHLRKEHLYCHLCDADGRNYYYASHTELAQHFRADHFLCEEGECAGDHLTSVFRSEIDLKAHKALAHGKGLARAAARQARTLELQFNITPHPNAQQRQREQRHIEPLVPQQVHQVAPPRIDTRSDQDFPRLSAAPPAPVLLAAPDTKTYSRGSAGLMRNDRNFPALGEASSSSKPVPAQSKQTPVSAVLHRNSKPSMSIQLQSQPASASNFRLTQPTGNRISAPPPQKKTVICDDDFPSLGFAKDDNPSLGAATPQPPKVTLINSNEMQALKKNKGHQQKKKPQLTSEAFPALSTTAAPAATPQWIKVSKAKEKQKQQKPEPPPQASEANFNPVADFPALPVNVTKNKQKKKSPPAPQINTVAPPVNEKKQSKKDKKKQNNDNKKENINSNSSSASEKKNNRDSNSVLANVNSNDNGDELAKNIEAPKVNGSVPPGFTKRPECDGMTFTNSSGQTFSAPVHTFIPPPDFEKRNMVLVEKFYKVLGDDAFETFKVASRAYRDSILSAKEFYQHCQMVLKSQMDTLFPELIALLPDIAKQQELVLGQKIVSLMKVCSTCGQLLVPEDSLAHEKAHWPALGSR